MVDKAVTYWFPIVVPLEVKQRVSFCSTSVTRVLRIPPADSGGEHLDPVVDEVVAAQGEHDYS